MVIAQRSPDPLGSRPGFRSGHLADLSRPIASLTFEQRQRFNVTYQLLKAESICLRWLPTDTAWSENLFVKCPCVVEMRPTWWAPEAKPGERPIRLPPRLNDRLGRFEAAPAPPSNGKQGQAGQNARQRDAAENDPWRQHLAALACDRMLRLGAWRRWRC